MYPCHTAFMFFQLQVFLILFALFLKFCHKQMTIISTKWLKKIVGIKVYSTRVSV